MSEAAEKIKFPSGMPGPAMLQALMEIATDAAMDEERNEEPSVETRRQRMEKYYNASE